MKILCLGHLTYDVMLPCSEFPKENTKNRYNIKNESVGGPATVAALLLAKWNMDVHMAGKLGLDMYGAKIKSELSRNRINTSFLEISDEFQTSHSFGLANESNGSRTLFVYRQKHEEMQDFELDFEPDIILIDGYEYEQSKRLLEQNKKAITILDANKESKEIFELAKMVQYLVCSKDFAESVTEMKFDFENKQSFVKIYQKLENIFKGNIVVTLEEHGCLYKIDRKIKLLPSIKVKTVDSTGAGDIFHGAFTYGLANGFDYEKTLKYANLAGALSVTKLGACNSIPNLQELEEIYEQIK